MDMKDAFSKMDPAADAFYRRKARRRLVILVASSVLLVVVIVGVVIGIVASRKDKGGSDSESPSRGGEQLLRAEGAVSPAIKTICSVTTYPEQCLSSLGSVNGSNNITDPVQFLRLSLVIAMDGLSRIQDLPEDLAESIGDPRATEALAICTEMVDESIELVNDSLALMTPETGERVLTESKVDDIRTYLSAVLTNQETCLDGLFNLTGDLQGRMALSMKNSSEFTSNCLAIATKILDLLRGLGLPVNRKLLWSSTLQIPEWLSRDPYRRRLLQAEPPGFTPDVTVAADGSGQFTSINEALAVAPEKSETPFVIYVKAGTYHERVEVPRKKHNIVMVGDGPGKTVVTGPRSVKGGFALYHTASFAVKGEGFMARDVTFENTAGPEGEQAVALVVKADHVVIFRCSVIGFQDSLYVNSFRQFYRNCDVVGTVDFIFGDAAVVFQNCNILPRQPGRKQKNLITAQGRKDPNSVGGISIHDCRVAAFDNLTAPTFLGRPWKECSRTVYMRTLIEGIIEPEGWRSWDGSGYVPSTIFYAEYMNTGPGASTAQRVKWTSYKPALSPAEADRFSVGSFIQGGSWIPGGVPYVASTDV